MKMKNRNQKKTNGASHAGDRVDLRAQIEKGPMTYGWPIVAGTATISTTGFKLNVKWST